MKDINVAPQNSTALNKVDSNMNSANKLLYIVVIEDPTVTGKYRFFALSKLDKQASFAEIVGYEITQAQSKKLKTWNDVTELADKSKIEIISMTFPWHRIINIKNVTYKAKVQ